MKTGARGDGPRGAAVRKSLVWGVLAALLLTGCPDGGGVGGGANSNVDKERLAVMQREPVVKLAVKPAHAEAGFSVSSKLPVHRSKLIADFADYAEPDIARKNGAQAIDALRDSGWTVFYARCEQLTFTAGAYKVADKVSYYAELTGVLREVHVSVVLQMRAPHSSESTSDLFADRPPALESGKSCLETNITGVADGEQLVLDELGPEPDGTPKPKGHR